MIVYVYDLHTNVKLHTYKNVRKIVSACDEYGIYLPYDEVVIIKKEGKKIVVYGF